MLEEAKEELAINTLHIESKLPHLTDKKTWKKMTTFELNFLFHSA